jgi:hypothetical protein
MIFKNFISIDKCHKFNINIIDNTAYFAIVSIEPTECKTFLLLLKTGIEYMATNKVQFVKQHIIEEDVIEFKNSHIISENGVFVVKTKIEDFLFELCNVLGIQRL